MDEFLKLYMETDIVRGQDDVIRGHASIYYNGQPGSQCQPYGDETTERIAPGAWDSCDMSDVYATRNHDDSVLLGRTPTSLKLFPSKTGLQFELNVVPTSVGANTLVEVQHQLLRGCSFIARPDKNSCTITRENGKRVVTINKFAELKEITVCVKPYYTAAAIARGQCFHKQLEEYQKHKERSLRVSKGIITTIGG